MHELHILHTHSPTRSHKHQHTHTRLGGGMSTFSRRNWKSRWFVLSDRRLVYSAMVGSEPLGAINIEDIETIEEVPSKTEFGFAIHTPKRTYWCTSASEDDRKVFALNSRVMCF